MCPISAISVFVSPTYLAECFAYDPETGILTWKARPESHFTCRAEWEKYLATQAGKPAGAWNGQDYLRVTVRGRRLGVHTIAWLLTYGSLPEVDIVHVNGSRYDNRIANLCAGRKAASGMVGLPPVAKPGRQRRVAGRRMGRRPGAPRT